MKDRAFVNHHVSEVYWKFEKRVSCRLVDAMLIQENFVRICLRRPQSPSPGHPNQRDQMLRRVASPVANVVIMRKHSELQFGWELPQGFSTPCIDSMTV